MSLIGDYGLPVIDGGGYVQLARDAGVFQDALELLQVRLAQDFLYVWSAIPEGTPRAQMTRRLTEQLADLVVVYGADAAAIASEYLTMIRNGDDLPMVLADPVQADRVGSSVNYLLSKPAARELLWGTMQRYAMEPYRETIRQSAFAAGNGFARVPNAGACDFCLMLSSRGAVYYSAEEAIMAGRARWSVGSGGEDGRYHNKCKCTATEVNRHAGLPEANVVLHDLWQKTFWKDGRRIHPDPVVMETAFPRWKEVLAGADLPWMSAAVRPTA